VTTPTASHLAVGRGTSYAAPVVSAVIGALRSYRPSLTPDDAESLLLSNANMTSAGKVLNAANAFAAAGIISNAQAAVAYPQLACLPDVVFPGVASTERTSPAPATTETALASAPVISQDVAGPPDQTTPPLVSPPTERGDSSPRPGNPIVRYVSASNGLLTVKISGRRAGETAIFRVTHRLKTGEGWKTVARTYARLASALRVKVDHWTSVKVLLRRADMVSEKAATVHSRMDLY
jgi:hypothetical protein